MNGTFNTEINKSEREREGYQNFKDLHLKKHEKTEVTPEYLTNFLMYDVKCCTHVVLPFQFNAIIFNFIIKLKYMHNYIYNICLKKTILFWYF